MRRRFTRYATMCATRYPITYTTTTGQATTHVTKYATHTPKQFNSRNIFVPRVQQRHVCTSMQSPVETSEIIRKFDLKCLWICLTTFGIGCGILVYDWYFSEVKKLERDLYVRTKTVLPFLIDEEILTEQKIKDIANSMNYETFVKLITQKEPIGSFNWLNQIASVLDDYLLLENMKRRRNGMEPLKFNLKFIDQDKIHYQKMITPLINKIHPEILNTDRNATCGAPGLYYAYLSTEGFAKWIRGRHYYAIVHTSYSGEECICFDAENQCRTSKILLGSFMEIHSKDGVKKLSQHLGTDALSNYIFTSHSKIYTNDHYELILKSLDYPKVDYTGIVIHLFNSGELPPAYRYSYITPSIVKIVDEYIQKQTQKN